MAAAAEMPYFIKPSVQLDQDQKRMAYAELRAAARATLVGISDASVQQSTLACLLKTYLPYAYWAGFYNLIGSNLQIGPYQGTLGCLTIALGRGVCGRAALEGCTIIENDVSALSEGLQHISCDPNTRSEIVVPCFGESGEVIAVLDIDSTLPGSFGELDTRELEALIQETFTSNI